MKSTVFVVMPFKEPYEGIYKQVFRPSLAKLGFHVVRADELLRSSVVVEDIEKSIKQADLVLIEATDPNPNVYLEFGIAMSLRKEMVLLTQKADGLPFDTRHIRHLVYDPNDVAALKRQFVRWVKDTRAYSLRRAKKATRRLVRGETFSDIFDSVSCVDTDSRSIEEQIVAEIRSGSMISCFHSYNTDKGTIHWLHLSSDPLYKVFHESIAFLSGRGHELFQAMGDAFVESNPDFVSLGPGNGHKDRVLMRALLEAREAQETDLFYYPVDVNRRMLGTAIQCLLSDTRVKDKIRVKAIHAVFNRLADFRPVFDFRLEPNLFVFLGNTLGNIQNELTFLHTLRNAMHKGDILLLEVRRRTTSLELGGHDEDQIGLSFSPIARLGVPFEPSKVERVEEDSFSQIGQTQTIATRYREAVIEGTKYENIVLSCVNYYDPRSLERCLCGKSLNFKLLEYCDSPLLAYYVVEKQ